MEKEKVKHNYDLYRYTGSFGRLAFFKAYLRDKSFRRICCYRGYNRSKGLKKLLYRILNHIVSRNTEIDLPLTCEIGEGLLFLHPHSLVINSRTVIGKNCTILNGVTIGNAKTGKIGSPRIGDNVYIGPNAVIVGNITIGSHSLIAGNAFVNFDVPDDSVVIGNPGVIHHKLNASDPYIVNSIDQLKQKG